MMVLLAYQHADACNYQKHKVWAQQGHECYGIHLPSLSRITDDTKRWQGRVYSELSDGKTRLVGEVGQAIPLGCGVFPLTMHDPLYCCQSPTRHRLLSARILLRTECRLH